LCVQMTRYGVHLRPSVLMASWEEFNADDAASSGSPGGSLDVSDYFNDQAPPKAEDIRVLCETFVCQGTDAAGDRCRRRLVSHNRGYCCVTHHTNLLKCKGCDRSYVHNGCFVLVPGARVLSSDAHNWQCDACISGLSGTSTVKDEPVSALLRAQEQGDQMVSDPITVFKSEDAVRKSARKNGWAVRSSQKSSSYIRFCCGLQK